jgi:aminopeptidase N
MRKACLALCSLLVCAGPALAQRLPTTAVPSHYTLWFAPDLEKDTFRGRETIQLDLKAPSTAITLNAAEISFGEVSITAAGTTQRADVTLDAAKEQATFTVPRQIPAGRATIQVTYTGILNDKLRGFYISKANNRKYAVTQLEATDARRAFPSFDEPGFKATFDISLMIDASDRAISNGRQISDAPGPEPGKHTVSFSRTPKMSTYLVAMLVGDFVCRSGAAEGTPIRVCATPDKLPLTGFALEAAQQQLRFYNKYFDIKYPFEKLDIIGVPDFAAGAMENTGAITFRERLLLVDPERASLGARKGVATVLSHEIAHQWFGDLVTMKWWDDIWLNEGFATWMASKPIAEWKPEWRVELDDVQDTQAALGLDALQSTRPIRTTAETPEQIGELFDGIAYEKTAAVLRMIEGYVGADGFRRAVASYLRRYSYGNASGEDFWTEVTRVTGKPVDRILRSFVDQPGAPLVTVRTACNAGRADVGLTQERFAGSPAATPPVPSLDDARDALSNGRRAQTWTIPACMRTENGNPQCFLLDRGEQRFDAGRCGPVFANVGGRGYYTTDYTPDTVRAHAASKPPLAPAERISLIGDEWWMVRSGRHNADSYLELAGSFAEDETPAVISTIGSRLAYAGEYLVAENNQSRYQSWLRDRFGPALRSLGLPGNVDDDDYRQSRRAALLSLVGATAADAGTQQRTRELAEQYLANPSSLAPTLVPTVLRVAAVSGDAALYDRYLAMLEKTTGQPEEYYRFLYSLAWFRDSTLISRTLQLALSPAIRSQDAGALIANVIASPHGREAGWEFTKTQWSALTQRLGTFQGLPSIISSLGGFCSTDKAKEVRQFFTEHPVPSSARTLQQAVERIETCAAIRARQAPAVERWLLAK